MSTIKNRIAPMGVVTVYNGQQIAARLKLILDIMDRAAKRAEGGHYDMHSLNRLACEALHDVIAEVSE